jgi:hypothetical protein
MERRLFWHQRDCKQHLRGGVLELVLGNLSFIGLTPDVNFTNILRAAFTLVGAKSAE